MSGLTSLPTRTAGSLGTMKFDHEPIADDKVDQHILAAEHNTAMEALEGVCDEVGEHDGSTPGSLVERAFTTSALLDAAIDDIAAHDARITALEGASDVLFEWNGTDLTQFDVLGDAGFTWSVTTWGTRHSTGDESPAIRVDNPGGSTLVSMLAVKTSLLPTLPRRFVMEFRYSNTTAVNTQDPLAVPYWENPTHFVCVRGSAGLGIALRDNSTTWVESAGIGYHKAGSGGTIMRILCEVDPATPLVKPYLAIGTHPHDSNATYEARNIPRGTRASWASSWTGLTHARRIGLGCRAFANSASPGNVFSDFRILRAT